MESTIKKTLDHILLLSRHLERVNLRGAIVVALMELDVPTKCLGFEFLKMAIELQRKDPTRTLAKDIYMEIALHYRQSSEFQVEQAIRDAIRIAWKRGNGEAWACYFSYGNRAMARPTNSDFISRIAYILEIWQECGNIGGGHDERE